MHYALIAALFVSGCRTEAGPLRPPDGPVTLDWPQLDFGRIGRPTAARVLRLKGMPVGWVLSARTPGVPPNIQVMRPRLSTTPAPPHKPFSLAEGYFVPNGGAVLRHASVTALTWEEAVALNGELGRRAGELADSAYGKGGCGTADEVASQLARLEADGRPEPRPARGSAANFIEDSPLARLARCHIRARAVLAAKPALAARAEELARRRLADASRGTFSAYAYLRARALGDPDGALAEFAAWAERLGPDGVKRFAADTARPPVFAPEVAARWLEGRRAWGGLEHAVLGAVWFDGLARLAGSGGLTPSSFDPDSLKARWPEVRRDLEADPSATDWAWPALLSGELLPGGSVAVAASGPVVVWAAGGPPGPEPTGVTTPALKVSLSFANLADARPALAAACELRGPGGFRTPCVLTPPLPDLPARSFVPYDGAVSFASPVKLAIGFEGSLRLSGSDGGRGWGLEVPVRAGVAY